MSEYITRKELADKLELSVKTLVRKEKKFGLDKARDALCAKPIRYHLALAKTQLKQFGHSLTTD